MTYLDFIENRIRSFNYGAPIYTSALAKDMAEEFQLPTKQAAAAVSVAMKRLMDSKRMTELRFYQKGIYYRARMTPFGETGINKDTLIADKYLAGDNGYETGLGLLHRMGLTTQIPAERVIATNKAASSIRADKSLGIFTCPPKVRIHAENVIVANQEGSDSHNRDGLRFQYVNGAIEFTKSRNPEEPSVLYSQGIREHV